MTVSTVVSNALPLFSDLNLHPELLKALEASGYTQPTPVQAQAIPAGMNGEDLLVCAQTGSGKTAAFMLPALHRLLDMPIRVNPNAEAAKSSRNNRNDRSRGGFDRRNTRPVFLKSPAKPRVLVLTPTRELALQVTDAAKKYAGHVRHLQAVAILGGMPYPKQMELLAKNPDILVATPGRLIDHIESGKIDLSELMMLVLDEADRMLDMGFIDDIAMIISRTPDTRQTVLFSATLEGEMGQIAKKFTKNARLIRVDTPQTRHENISQALYFVDDMSHKNRLLDQLLQDESMDQAIVFTATKRDADTISDRLKLAGHNTAALHGDMQQGARNRTLTAMRQRKIRILVATDVAARGLDVPTITHVFNYDLPKFAEDYVHRIGRTGRAGRNGAAISLAHHAERFAVSKIERFTSQQIPVTELEGFEPQKKFMKAAPKKFGGRGNGGNGSRGAPSRSSGGRNSQDRAGFSSAPRSDRNNDRSNDRSASGQNGARNERFANANTNTSAGETRSHFTNRENVGARGDSRGNVDNREARTFSGNRDARDNRDARPASRPNKEGSHFANRSNSSGNRGASAGKSHARSGFAHRQASN